MINFIVVGKSKRVVVAILQAIRSFTDAKCIVVGDEETRCLRWSTLAKRQIMTRFDGSDDDNFANAINRIVEKTPHVRLIPADCDGIRLTNRVRNRLRVKITPTPDLSMLNMFDDKWHFHQFCVQHGLAVPPTRFAATKSDLDFDTIAGEFGVPFVVKPVNQAGSFGVEIIRSKAHFEQAIRDNANYRFAPLIAQRYIDGVDIDLSLLSVQGQVSAYAIQQVAGSMIHFVSNPALEEMAEKLCKVSAYHGVMHIDARIEKATGNIFLIESNPRFWASLTASVWCGLNFVAESIEQTPRPQGARRQLTAGKAYTRHPVIRPSSWLQLVADSGERGRLIRAMTFDLPTLGDFSKEFPSMFWKYANKRAGAHIKGPRHTKA